MPSGLVVRRTMRIIAGLQRVVQDKGEVAVRLSLGLAEHVSPVTSSISAFGVPLPATSSEPSGSARSRPNSGARAAASGGGVCFDFRRSRLGAAGDSGALRQALRDRPWRLQQACSLLCRIWRSGRVCFRPPGRSWPDQLALRCRRSPRQARPLLPCRGSDDVTGSRFSSAVGFGRAVKGPIIRRERRRAGSCRKAQKQGPKSVHYKCLPLSFS